MTVSSTSLMSNSMQSIDASTRYMGMIEVSAYKKTRNSLFFLFDYVTQTAPSMTAMHVFITAWRLLQCLGPAFCADYFTIWREGTVMKQVINVLAVLFHLVPPSAREEYGAYAMYVYCGLTAIVFALVFGSSFYFVANAKLPGWIPTFIAVWFGSVGYILQPVAGVLAGETLGRIVRHWDTFGTAINIAAVALTAVFIAVYTWIFTTIYCFSLTFKPDSFMTVVPNIQMHIFLGTTTITAVAGLASQLWDIPRYVITFIDACLYLLLTSLLPQKGGLVSQVQFKILTATTVSSSVLLIIFMIFDIAKFPPNEFFFLALACVWGVCYMIVHCAANRSVIRHMQTLDAIDYDKGEFEAVKTPREACGLIVSGFRMAHPVCISYDLVKLAIDRWPTNVDLWLIFAKFTAIYPELTQQLSYVSMGMIQNHLKGSLSKQIHQQIQSVMRQRETNLIQQLKSKLDKVGKQVQGTKHKIRYIWDLVIQGNVKEIETVIDRAYVAIDLCEAEFLHLLRQFPNSRFVARSYARFLRDVVADHAGHKVWAQNVSLLQRGLAVTADQCHERGLAAFPALPKTLDANLGAQQQTQVMTEDTLTQEIEADDEQAAIDAELRVSVRDSINSLKIPSIKRAKMIRGLALLILFIIPVIAFTVYIPILLASLIDPLDFMYTISLMRVRMFQVMSNVIHYSAEHLNCTMDGYYIFPLMSSSNIAGIEDPPEGFGGTYDPIEQTNFLTDALSSTLTDLRPLMSYKNENSYMDGVRSILFSDQIPYRAVSAPEYPDGDLPDDETDMSKISWTITDMNKSAQSITTNFVILSSEFMELGLVPPNIFNQPVITVFYNNIRATTDNLATCLELLRAYVSEVETDIRNFTTIIMGVVVCAVPIIYLIVCILTIRTITREKMMIYKCLTSLPKSVVSKVADSFKVLKKEEDEEMKTSKSHDDELNKQEENMLKTFTSSCDNGGARAGDVVVIILSTVVIVLIHIAITVLFCVLLQITGKSLEECAPHVEYTPAAYSYNLATVILLHTLIGVQTQYVRFQVPNFALNRIYEVIPEWQLRSQTSFAAVMYGSEELDTRPFAALGANIRVGQPLITCPDGHPTNEHEIYGCFTPDTLLGFVNSRIMKYLFLRQYQDEIVQGNGMWLPHIWHMHQEHIYEAYFRRMFISLVPEVQRIINAQIPVYFAIIYVLLVIAIITELIFLRDMAMSESRQKFALKLLLHCPGNVVVSNPSITALLSGNFQEKSIDSTNRKSDFYELLVQEMPDAIIILDHNGIIQNVNTATHRIFGFEKDALVGQSITVLGEQFHGDNPFHGIFDQRDKSSNLEKMSFEKTLVYEKPGESGQMHIEVMLTIVGENAFVSGRDVSQTVTYNKLIADERAKSDQLLSSILPASLVGRVQAGEKNISFAVQSATISFMDIVSFTPWCGSLPASTVMATLNKLFKAFDRLVLLHSTMTKIKCIGDCYMCAGGIFAEINQPAEHARDVVEFGLDAISALLELNQQIDQNLRIRVGVNTGGPIIAGVLGTAKPTFEILGPAINMAQQMEHHGVPMKVHVSRSVYELIYGGNFVVKERGEIEIKNGTVVTYLIESKKSKK